jgi:RNA polymerase sigma factor (sigma-70 family)
MDNHAPGWEEGWPPLPGKSAPPRPQDRRKRRPRLKQDVSLPSPLPPPPRHPADLRRAQSAAAGDEAIWRELLEPFRPKLLDFILVNGTSNEDEARDLVQDILLTLRLRIETYEGTGSLESWMWGVARLKIKSWQRDHLAHLRDLSSLAEDGDDPEDDDGGINLTHSSSEKFLNSLATHQSKQEAARQRVKVRFHTMLNQDEDAETRKPTRRERARERAAKRLLPGRVPRLKDPHLRKAMWRLFHELNPKEKQALRLWSRSLPLREVATILGISEDAAEKRVARARERLRAMFTDWKNEYDTFFVGNHGG